MEDFEHKKSTNKLDIYAYAKEFNINIEEIQCKPFSYVIHYDIEEL